MSLYVFLVEVCLYVVVYMYKHSWKIKSTDVMGPSPYRCVLKKQKVSIYILYVYYMEAKQVRDNSKILDPKPYLICIMNYF